MSGPSNALVATNQQGGPNFAQQGSVDWVSLSNSTLGFSVEILSRFSKAGVEMITVAVGQAIFSTFVVPSAGQKRVTDAVAKLKVFSSYGNVLWFGFGIKHVVRTLCETEQGATCAAICACLSVSYDLSLASQVLKALTDEYMTPGTLTPALSQVRQKLLLFRLHYETQSPREVLGNCSIAESSIFLKNTAFQLNFPLLRLLKHL